MLDFVINPTAGKGKAGRYENILRETLLSKGVDFRFHETTHEKHAVELTRQLVEKGADNIISVGGDGTIHEVLNGLDNFERINFGIIGAGSGNDFLSSVKIPLDPSEALNLILTKPPRYVDYMDCSGVRGINIIGAGIDTEILQRCIDSKVLNGKLQYVLSLIISLIKFKYNHFNVVKNGETFDKTALIVCICNGTDLGGGIPMCPVAKPDDGKLNYVLINRVSKLKIPYYFVKLMKGKILDLSVCDTDLTDALNIVFDTPTTIQIDGELYHDLPFDVSIVSNTLKLYY